MKKILAIAIGLFSYLISNIKLDASKAAPYYFANTKGGLVLTKVTDAVDLKDEKSIWNNIRHDADAENQYYLQEPYMPFIIGGGVMYISCK
jgi:hypothetical protein